MTREDIISMAREAGLETYLAPHWDLYEELERFAALVAKHTLANIDPSSFMSWQEGHEAGRLAEREACLDWCAAYAADDGTAQKIAAAIRARGNK